jgi:hypothetical protein
MIKIGPQLMKTIAQRLADRALLAVLVVFMLNLGGLATHAEAQTAPSSSSSYNVILMMSQPTATSTPNAASGAATVTSTSNTPGATATISNTPGATATTSNTPAATAAATGGPGAGGALSSCSCSNEGNTYACDATFTGTITKPVACPAGYVGTGTASATGPYICSNVGVIEPDGLVHTVDDFSGCVKYTNPVYSACGPACGASTETLTSYSCVNANGAAVAESVCQADGAVPPATMACNDYSTCTYTPTNVTYSPTCSNTCGTGTETLASYTCTRSDGAVVADSFCTPPAATQACSDISGCTYTPTNVTYSPTCSNTCGTGTETLASYTCTRSDGAVVADSFCTPPAATQACSDISGCTYTPTNVTYGSCAASCGSSTAPLNTSWTCTRADGAVVDNSYCVTAGKIPPATESCTDYHACVDAPVYGGCSANCGTGTQALQSYTCGPAGNTGEYSSTQCASFGVPAPAASNGVTCTDNSGCNYTYAYSGATYGACNPACGASTQALTGYTCTRSDGAVVAAAYCQTAGAVPPGAQTCTDYSACTYTPSITYGPCTPACGVSSEPFTSTCTRSDGVVVDSSFCPAAAIQNVCTDYSLCAACGSDNGGNFPANNPPWSSNRSNLCIIGGVSTDAGSGNATYDGVHFGYTCSTSDSSVPCQANVITVGPVNGQTVSSSPFSGSLSNQLCMVGGVPTSQYAENENFNGTTFTYDCAGVSGSVTATVYCGNAEGSLPSAAPWTTSLAGQLCSIAGEQTQSQSANGAVGPSGTWTWTCGSSQCSTNSIGCGTDNSGFYTAWPDSVTPGHLCNYSGSETDSGYHDGGWYNGSFGWYCGSQYCSANYATYNWWPTGVACNNTCGTGSYYGTSYECVRNDNAIVDNSYCLNTVGAANLNWWEAHGGSATCTDDSGCTPTCGPDNGGAFYGAPWNENPGNLCQTGGVASAAGSSNGQNPNETWTWYCGSQYCSATQVLVGTCGPLNGGSDAGNPSIDGNAGNLCAGGSSLIPGSLGADINYNWTWQCVGDHGGTTVTCGATCPTNTDSTPNGPGNDDSGGDGGGP